MKHLNNIKIFRRLIYFIIGIVFISGNGSNLQKLIDTVNNSLIKIELVVSNRKKAYGLERAKNHDIPTLYFPYLRKKMDRVEYDLKDELIRQTIMDTQEDVEEIKETIEKIDERLYEIQKNR